MDKISSMWSPCACVEMMKDERLVGRAIIHILGLGVQAMAAAGF